MFMKKKIVSTVAGAILLSSLTTVLPENPVTTSHVQNKADAKSKALSTINLSKSETKQMSKKMTQISGSKGATIIESIVGATGAGIPAALASSLARSSVDKEIVHKAAHQNKRIQIKVYPGDTPNLKKFKYKII